MFEIDDRVKNEKNDWMLYKKYDVILFQNYIFILDQRIDAEL